MNNCVAIAPARADRRSDPLEKHTKSKENATLEPTRQKAQQKRGLWDTFGMILMAKTHQARDKTAHRSHNDPDIRKHNVFEGQGPDTLYNTCSGGPTKSENTNYH